MYIYIYTYIHIFCEREGECVCIYICVYIKVIYIYIHLHLVERSSTCAAAVRVYLGAPANRLILAASVGCIALLIVQGRTSYEVCIVEG